MIFLTVTWKFRFILQIFSRRIVVSALMNISRSIFFPTTLSPARSYQNCLAVFGCYEYSGLAPEMYYNQPDYAVSIFLGSIYYQTKEIILMNERILYIFHHHFINRSPENAHLIFFSVCFHHNDIHT